jgi:hypothetical protein
VEVVIGPVDDDDGTAAANPANPYGISFSVRKPGGFSASEVYRGARHSANIYFIWQGKASPVFTMKTISGFSDTRLDINPLY